MSLKPAGARQQAFTTCTLKDLCPEDKQKVAQLVKQVVELGKENQQLKVAATTAASAEEKLRQIQDCNKEAVKENCSLKSKLGQAITVLRMYHHKVQGLDAALRALQHSATDTPAGTQQQQQQDEAQGDQQQEQQQQQQQQQQQDEATDTLALPAPAPASTAAAARSNSPGPQQQRASEPSPGVQQPAVQQCLCSKLLCGELSAGPAVLPGSSLAVSLPLQQLAALQLQDSSLFAEQLVSQPRTVLQFDASLGTQGAYVLRELPQQPQQLQVLGGRTPAGSPAAAPVLQLPAQQQLSPQPQQQEQEQGPQRMSAGGAATAAAAAAASSALAAVKAAAAACAATPWQPDLSSCSTSSPQHLQQVPVPAGDAYTRLSDPAQHLAAHSTAACGQAAGGAARGHSPAGPPGDCSHLDQQARAGPGGLWAVEEVPLLDVASAPVHVLVQNEKSASSLHQACARVTLAGGMAEGTASPLPPSPPAAAVYAAGGVGLPAPASSCSGRMALQPQEGPELWPPGPQQYDRPLGHDPVPSGKQGRDQQVQQWVMQHQHQQQQQEEGHQLMQPSSLQQGASGLQRSCMASSASPASADQQQFEQQAHAWGQPHSQRAAAAAGQGPIAGHWQHQQQQQTWFEHQQQQPEPGPLAHGVDEASSRALLQKFDASLVDILAEVERLEQQQAAARQQLHQQGHQQQQQQRRRQHRPAAQQQVQQQHAVAGSGGQGWQQDQGLAAAGSLAAASCKPNRHELLHQKHAQLQQRMMQLQREEAGRHHSSGLYSAGRKLAGQQQVLSAGGWGYGSAAEYDADDVSDILNHLD